MAQKSIFHIGIALLAVLLVYGCGSIGTTGGAAYNEDIERMKDVSSEALEEMGMTIREVSGDATNGYFLSGERSYGAREVEEGADAPADLLTLEVEIIPSEDGTVKVIPTTPAATEFSGSSDQDLSEQFFSYLDEMELDKVDNE